MMVGRTVLVVESDDGMRDAIERLLNEAGFACTAYSSAGALLARGVDEDSACVISNLRLPGMSGLELLATLRERYTSLPFILIATHDAPGQRQKAMSCGAAAYLTKPLRGAMLLEAVRVVLESTPPS